MADKGAHRSEAIEVDYLIIGAGAVGMAFADVLLAETDATIAIVDRRYRPGGHWNDAYPFVRLHQPSSFYGVNSRTLGTGAKDEVGHNQGMFELASGQEVLSHFDLTMQQQFLPSGRVRWFPMSNVDVDGTISSLMSGERTEVTAQKVVDATHSQMHIPSVDPPRYAVDPSINCVPPNELPRCSAGYDQFVVVGAGKTAMDTCIWLLDTGTPPDRIRWIAPRDSWLLDRRNYQPGEEYFTKVCKGIADQVEAVAIADSINDIYLNLEAREFLTRVDSTITPEAYHCAVISPGELEQLRSITGVIRLGRVTRLTPDEIILEHGSVPAEPNTLYVDCSSAGIPRRPSTPIFAGNRITPQWIRTCQPTFSAAFIAHVDSTYDDDDLKNLLCTPIEPPEVPLDYARMFQLELATRTKWDQHPEIRTWSETCRLDPFSSVAKTQIGVNAEATEHLGRYLTNYGLAVEKLDRLLGPV
jgi:hypothetical protein